MSVKKIKVTTFKKNSNNPFMEDTKVHVEIGKKSILMGNKDDSFMVNKEGNILGHSIFAKIQKVDKTQFAKIYINNLSLWFDLSKTGIRVLTYVIQSVKPNTDYFMFDLEECMKITGYKSDVSVWKGMAELLECKFIARSTKSYIYFINPTIFFNGDRVSFINSYQVMENVGKKKIEYTKDEIAGVLERNPDLKKKRNESLK